MSLQLTRAQQNSMQTETQVSIYPTVYVSLQHRKSSWLSGCDRSVQSGLFMGDSQWASFESNSIFCKVSSNTEDMRGPWSDRMKAGAPHLVSISLLSIPDTDSDVRERVPLSRPRIQAN